MSLLDYLKIALFSIRLNLLRAILTMCIIAFGIMALIGMFTAISGLETTLIGNFAQMGTNSFTITSGSLQVHGPGRRQQNEEEIDIRQAQAFKEQYDFTPYTSIYFTATGAATVRAGEEETNPNVTVMGVDEDYLATSALELAEGRGFSENEVQRGARIAILGSSLKEELFGTQSALQQPLTIGSHRFRVAGVLEKRGSSFGMTQDNQVLIPLTTARQLFPAADNFQINSRVFNIQQLEPATQEAEALFRIIRGMRPGDASNFTVQRSDSLAKQLTNMLRYLELVALIIAIVTLIGALVGLMNIMLVSVTERIREIGTRKAIGANTANIRNQFLLEAVLISTGGGIAGILIGLVLGNLVSMIIGGVFSVPWDWVIIGVSVSIVVGVLAGLLPALRAAKQDPIVALRHE